MFHKNACLLPALLVSAVLLLGTVSGCATGKKDGKPPKTGTPLTAEQIEQMTPEELDAFIKQQDEQEKKEKGFFKQYAERRKAERDARTDVTKSSLLGETQTSKESSFPWRKDYEQKSEKIRNRSSSIYDW